MLLTYHHISFDLTQPIDISTPLHAGEPQINCYFAPPFKIEAFVMGDFIGDMKQGGLLNYKNVSLNPHGNGTHTECVSHIANLPLTINQALNTFHFLAQLITISPKQIENGDYVILKEQIINMIPHNTEAFIIRTKPNTNDKLNKNYNKTNPPYLHHETAAYLREQKIQHLLIDLPSVDREEDGGKLLAHHAYWNFPDDPRLNATITELIFVPDSVPDGPYLLNLQIPSFEMDAAPSKPVLFPPV